jgi:hypothetical protein
MGTSFAPSPTDSVIQVPFLLARATTSDFCLGDTLQQMTELALHPNLKKLYDISNSSKTIAKVKPSMTIDIFSYLDFLS